MALTMISDVRLNEHVAATLASTAGFGIGVTLGWSSLAGVALYVAIGWEPSNVNLVLITSIVGAAFLSLLMPSLVWLDRLVSKQELRINSAIAASSFVLIISWIVMCFADYVFLNLIFGRLIAGLAIGSLLTLVPLYISETVSATYRDSYIFLFHAMMSTGVSCTYFIATHFYQEDVIPLGRYNLWCMLAVVIPGLLCALVPASPLQRVQNEEDRAARQVLRRLVGVMEIGEAQLVGREIERVRQLAQALQTTWSDYKSLKMWQFWRAFSTCACIMGLQQLSGASLIFSNALTVFDQIGTGPITGTQLTVVCGATQIVASILAVALVRFVGRGRLVSASLMGMGFCLMTLFFITLNKTTTTDDPIHSCHDWLPPTLLALYFAAYSLGAGPVAWSLIADSFPLQLRIPSASVIVSMSFLLCLALHSLLTVLITFVGLHWTLFILSSFCLFGAVIAHLIVIEAPARNLADVQDEFRIG